MHIQRPTGSASSQVKNFVYYSVALDTSKDLTETEQLSVYIREVIPDFKIFEEYLTLRSIRGSTKGTDIFREFQVTLLEAQLYPSKLFAVATDGCPFMLGSNQKLQGLKKWHEENDLASVTLHHCILHQKSLVGYYTIITILLRNQLSNG